MLLGLLALASLALRCAAIGPGDDPNLGSPGSRSSVQVQNAATSPAPRAQKVSKAPAGTYSRSAPLAFNYKTTKVYGVNIGGCVEANKRAS